MIYIYIGIYIGIYIYRYYCQRHQIPMAYHQIFLPSPEELCSECTPYHTAEQWIATFQAIKKVESYTDNTIFLWDLVLRIINGIHMKETMASPCISNAVLERQCGGGGESGMRHPIVRLAAAAKIQGEVEFRKRKPPQQIQQSQGEVQLEPVALLA